MKDKTKEPQAQDAVEDELKQCVYTTILMAARESRHKSVKSAEVDGLVANWSDSLVRWLAKRERHLLTSARLDSAKYALLLVQDALRPRSDQRKLARMYAAEGVLKRSIEKGEHGLGPLL